MHQRPRGAPPVIAPEHLPAVPGQYLVKLDPKQYETLVSSLPQIDPRTTDPVQAGIALGVQLALQRVREGFTYGV